MLALHRGNRTLFSLTNSRIVFPCLLHSVNLIRSITYLNQLLQCLKGGQSRGFHSDQIIYKVSFSLDENQPLVQLVIVTWTSTYCFFHIVAKYLLFFAWHNLRKKNIKHGMCEPYMSYIKLINITKLVLMISVLDVNILSILVYLLCCIILISKHKTKSIEHPVRLKLVT